MTFLSYICFRWNFNLSPFGFTTRRIWFWIPSEGVCYIWDLVEVSHKGQYNRPIVVKQTSRKGNISRLYMKTVPCECVCMCACIANLAFKWHLAIFYKSSYKASNITHTINTNPLSANWGHTQRDSSHISQAPSSLWASWGLGGTESLFATLIFLRFCDKFMKTTGADWQLPFYAIIECAWIKRHRGRVRLHVFLLCYGDLLEQYYVALF